MPILENRDFEVYPDPEKKIVPPINVDDGSKVETNEVAKKAEVVDPVASAQKVERKEGFVTKTGEALDYLS